MKKSLLILSAAIAVLAFPMGARAADATPAPKKIVLGFVAKSNDNPVFQVARVGAEDEAKKLSKDLGIAISIDWRTPDKEDAQKQAQAIEQLVQNGAAGIAVSASDANKVTDAINTAVKNGVPVTMFDSDAPASARFAIYGTDDTKCGQLVMSELAKQMGGKGVVAILGGNQNAPNLQKRVQGVREEAKKYPGITIRDAYYFEESTPIAVAEVEKVMQSNPDITGWAMIGGWPLFTDNALKWKAGEVKCVSVDALPQQLQYIRNGQVQELLAQQCYQWGAESVDLLIDKIVHNKTPPAPFVDSPLVPVTKENVEEYSKNWDKWLPKK